MKKNRFIGYVLACAAILGLCGAFGGVKAYAASPGKGEISVSGEGSVNVNPDVAYVSLGVSTQDVSPKVAMESNNALIAAVIEAVKGAGVADRDIQTTGFYMNQSYDYSTGREQPTGYNVSNNLTVVVREIDKVGELIGIASDAGANVFGGVEFGLLDSTAVYNDALKLALADASGKARTLADALAKTIGAPVSVTESGSGYVPVEASALNRTVVADASGVPVQAGKLTITANVQVVYEYDL